MKEIFREKYLPEMPDNENVRQIKECNCKVGYDGAAQTECQGPNKDREIVEVHEDALQGPDWRRHIMEVADHDRGKHNEAYIELVSHLHVNAFIPYLIALQQSRNIMTQPDITTIVILNPAFVSALHHLLLELLSGKLPAPYESHTSIPQKGYKRKSNCSNLQWSRSAGSIESALAIERTALSAPSEDRSLS